MFIRGVADLANKSPIEAGDRWRIASVAKAFSGAVALRLVEQGKLSLDDTIAQRLPSLPAAWGQVTLAEALQHTSGLPDYTKSPAFAAAFQANPRKPIDPHTLISYVANDPLLFSPGSKYHYSDTDNIVVALFAEAATGLPYDYVLSQLVLDPLQLRHTSLPAGYRMPAPYVHGYAEASPGKEEDVSEILNPTGAWASGGIVSSPADLITFIRAYGGGSMITGQTRASQLHFVPGSSGPPGPGTNLSGLGIFEYKTSCGTVYGHTGNIPGYTAFIASSPNGSRAVTVLISTQLNPTLKEPGATKAFAALRRTEELAVCAAMR